MPKFKQEPIKSDKSGRSKGLPQDIVDSFKSYIKDLKKGHKGILEFEEGENIEQGRKALIQAGEELKMYIKARKARGQERVLHFEKITKKEYMETKTMAAERGKKIAKAKSGS